MADIVEKYASSLAEFKLSEFIRTEKQLISQMEYEFSVDWKSLKNYWCSVCDNFANSKDKKFVKDSNVVDWDNLVGSITRKHMLMTARNTSYQLHAVASGEVAEELSSPFLVETSILDKSFIIKSKIAEFRKNATYTSEIHNQDLLYYGIIDLVKNGACATKTVLKEELEELTDYMKNYLKIGFENDKAVKNYAKQILKNISDLKTITKEEKRKIRGLVEEKDASYLPLDRKRMKATIKLIKLFVSITENGQQRNWLKNFNTEPEFMIRFVTPMMDLMLKQSKTGLIFKPGEQKLQLVKDYENSALSEDDTRLPGPNIDGIIKNASVDVPIALLEVSGSPDSPGENYSHFKGDRNKLAKNLKYLFKVIISMKGAPSFDTACKIKLFGVHIYHDQLYLYSLSMPMWDIFIFKLDYKFSIPIRPTLFSFTLPSFFCKLTQVGEILESYSERVETFLSTNDYESSSSSDSDKSHFSNPKISPKKRRHHQRT